MDEVGDLAVLIALYTRPVLYSSVKESNTRVTRARNGSISFCYKTEHIV